MPKAGGSAASALMFGKFCRTCAELDVNKGKNMEQQGDESCNQSGRCLPMTSEQQACIDRLLATYEANLYFFKEHFPVLFAKIMAVHVEKLPFAVATDGGVTIEIGRHRGRLADFIEFHKKCYETFDDEATRRKVTVTSGHLDDLTQVATHERNADFYRPIEPRFRRELVSHFQSLVDREAASGEPCFGVRRIPLVLVFGTGVGWHLEKLVGDYEIFSLIIVETDVERLMLSLYFTNYAEVHRRFSEKGQQFLVVCDEDIKVLATGVLISIKRMCPPYFIQGAGLMFQSPDLERMRDVWESIKRDMLNLYRGWGYIDDEVLGLKQAVENAQKGYPLLKRKISDMPDDAVAFVVGNGPSLDGLLPLLRKYKDRAVIFSCGTAISALANIGIKPDFHVEIERTAFTYRLLNTEPTRSWLKDVPIITSAVMAPAVFGLTDKAYLFLKDSDSGSHLLDPEKKYPRLLSNPTCTNGGLEVAIHVGFKQIYLLGVDFGYRDPEHHHSKSSLYYSCGNASLEISNMTKHVHEYHSKQIDPSDQKMLMANFDSAQYIVSTLNLTMARDAMTFAIARASDAKIYNPNHGAFIEGAVPVLVDQIVIPSGSNVKSEVLRRFHEAFEIYHCDSLCHTIDVCALSLECIASDIGRMGKQKIDTVADVVFLFSQLNNYIDQAESIHPVAYFLIKGGMLHMARFSYDCISRLRNKDDIVAFSLFAFELFERFMFEVRNNLLSLKVVPCEYPV